MEKVFHTFRRMEGDEAAGFAQILETVKQGDFKEFCDAMSKYKINIDYTDENGVCFSFIRDYLFMPLRLTTIRSLCHA